MGQYYTPLLISADNRIVTLSPHSFDNSAKLMEHSWIGNEFVNAAYTLIFGKPKKVAWIGDYSEESYDPDKENYAKALPYDEFKKYYDCAMADETLAQPKYFSKRGLDILNHDTRGMYLLNHSKQEYIDLEAYIRENTEPEGDWEGYCVNPLPLLTACGNGFGGGDYHENRPCYEFVGTWAFDLLEYSDNLPAGYRQIQPQFRD